MKSILLLIIVFSFSLLGQVKTKERVEELVPKIDSKIKPTTDSYTLEGLVLTDKYEPYPSANVIIEGTAKGTVTDWNGYFQLSDIHSDSIKIWIRAIGYEELRDTIYFSSNQPAIKTKYYLTHPYFEMILPKITEWEVYHSETRKAIKNNKIVMELTDHKTYSDSLNSVVKVVNNSNKSIWLLKPAACYQSFRTILTDEKGDTIKPNSINLGCDTEELLYSNPESNYLTEIYAGSERLFNITELYELSTLSPGRYNIEVVYFYPFEKILYFKRNETVSKAEYAEASETQYKMFRGKLKTEFVFVR